MTFARLPSQAPQFDATAFTNALQKGIAPGVALAKQFIGWKRWVEATTEQDGVGLRDVVAANAQGLNAVKTDVDEQQDEITALAARVAAVEARPVVPFPGSGP